MIKYIGSKRTLLNHIGMEIGRLFPIKTGEKRPTVIDLFSGSSRIGHHLKSLGYTVHSNDMQEYAYILALCHVVADQHRMLPGLKGQLKKLNNLEGVSGYFTKKFCEEARFFQPKNGMKIDAIREWIEDRSVLQQSEIARAVILTSLMEAADRVDSTIGVQAAYLKSWASRAHNDLELRIPKMLLNQPHMRCTASNLDALECLKQYSANVIYMDPPYNQHKYNGNYHIWNTLVKWDKPETYGKANKRMDVQEYKSDFTSKPRIASAMKNLVEIACCDHLVVSFNNEGYIKKDQMIEILSTRGDVQVREIKHQRHVGSKIGIHNLKGEKVGKTTHTENIEYLFIV